MIASSPTDIQPVLDTVAEHAAKLCDASDALIFPRGQRRFSCKGRELWLDARPRTTSATRLGVEVRWVELSLTAKRFMCMTLRLFSESDFPVCVQTRGVAMGVRTALVAPLLREGISIGAIYIRRSMKSVRSVSAK